MNVAVASASGADVRVLTDWSGFDGFPVWSPDGRWIAFASDRDATQAQIDANATSGVDTGFSLYTMSSDGSEVTMIVDAGDRAILPTSWKA
jgi:Tol biopolymer transport system component